MTERILRTVAGILAAVGFLLIIGAAGTSDYYVEIGVYYPISETLKQSGAGILLMLPALILFRKWPRR